ncbi:MAG: hypothetical protein ACQET8_19020 [Bacillota bacterium]
MEWIYSFIDIGLTLLYLYCLYLTKRFIEKKVTGSLIVQKLLYASSILIISLLIVFFTPREFIFFLYAFALGGITYSIIIFLLSMVLPLLKSNRDRYNKVTTWINKF